MGRGHYGGYILLIVSLLVSLFLLVSPVSANGIACGLQHFCYSRGGRIQCIGLGDEGQLGTDGTALSGTTSTIPSLTFSDTNPSIAVAAGYKHTCALFGGKLERRVRCWGQNTYGQLGQGNTNNYANGIGPNLNTIPYVDLTVSEDTVISIAAGGDQTCTLSTQLDPTSPSNMRCWGRGDLQALGHPLLTGEHIGDNANELSQLPYLDFGGGQQTVLQMAVGYQHTCALFSLGIKCWGSSTYGQTGQGTMVDIGRGIPLGEPSNLRRRRAESRRRRRPNQVAGSTLSTIPYIPFANDGNKPVHVTAGGYHTCSIFSNGKARCWGRGDFGQNGNETSWDIGKNPGDMPTLPYLQFKDVISVSSIRGGGYHTCATFLAGGVRCWGRNNQGQLGINAATAQVGAAAGEMTTINFIPWTPVREVMDLFLGDEFSCGLFEDNAALSFRRVKCWGRGNEKQLGTDATANAGTVANPTNSLQYIYLNIEGQTLDVFSVNPTGGTSSGGGTLTLTGPPLHISRAIVLRFQDDSTTPATTLTISAQTVSSTAVVIDIPGWNMGGRDTVTVRVLISVNGITYVDTHSTYTYLAQTALTVSSKSVSLNGAPYFFTAVEDIQYITEPILCRFKYSATEFSLVRATLTTSKRIDCGSSPQVSQPYSGTLELSVTAGSSWQSYQLDFLNVTVSGLSPSRGPIQGSGKLVITGSGFVNNGDKIFVRFFDGLNAAREAEGTFVSATEIECTTPDFSDLLSVIATPYSVEVSLSVNNKVEYVTVGNYLLYVIPTVVAVDPVAAPITGAPLVTVSGSNFFDLGGFFVRFSNGTHFQVNVATLAPSGDYLTAAAPAFTGGGVGTVEASYNGIDFTANLVPFSYFEVTSVAPGGGPLTGATEVTLTGIGFVRVGTAKCKFGASVVPAIVSSETKAVCTSPAMAAGSVAVELSIDGINFGSDARQFIYYNKPTITKIEPLSGASSLGRTSIVTLFGSGFTPVGVSMQCKIGSKVAPAELKVIGATSVIECTVRDGSSTLPLSLAQNGQNFELTGFFYAYYDYFLLSPTLGPTSGGTNVILTGTGFKPSPGARCSFGSTEVPATIISSVKVLCVAPRSSSGKVTVEYSADSFSFTASAKQFEYYSSPIVTAISPISAPDSGGITVTVHGVSLRDTGSIKMKFGRKETGASALGSGGSALFTGTVPSGTGVVPVEISQNNGVFYTDNRVSLTYNSVAQITPTWGPVGESTLVSVSGSGFLASNATFCKFGTAYQVPAVVLSPQEVTCTTTSNSTLGVTPGSYNLRTTTNGKDFTASFALFNYYLTPNITKYEPTSGPGAPKSGNLLWLTITGAGFQNTNLSTCLFGSTPSPDVQFNSTKMMKCKIPPGSGEVTITFAMNGQNGIRVGTFAYFTVSSITPKLGPATGSTTISINGDGFTPAAGLSCRLNGTKVDATYVSPVLVVCRVPAKSVPTGTLRLMASSGSTVDYVRSKNRLLQSNTTTAPVVPTTPTLAYPVEASTNGQDFTSAPDATQGVFTYYNTPSVTAITPDRGETAGKTTVTVLGSGFVNSTAMACRFGSDAPITAVYLNVTAAICNSTTHVEGSVDFAITFNSQDYHLGPTYLYEACKPGEFAKDFQTPCTKCENATFSAFVGSLNCKLCEPTEYTLNVGSSQCESCPDNTHIPTDDRDSLSKCQCMAEFYHPDAVTGKACIPCPEGATCAGGTDPPLSINEYWHHPAFPFIHMRCDNPQACPGGPPETCALGYDGRLCSKCAKGYYAQGRFCEVCPQLAVWILVAFVIFSTLAAALLVKMVGKEASSFGATLSIATFFFQTLGMLNQLQLTWPSLVRRLVNMFTGPFNLNIDILALECTFPVQYRSKWVTTMGMPVAFMGLFAAFFAVGYVEEVWKRNKLLEKLAAIEENSDAESLLGSDDESIPEPTEENPYGLGRKALVRLFGLKNRLINAYILFLVLAYVVLVTTSVAILDCTTRKDGISTLDIFPALNCYESWWWFFAPMATVTTTFYGFVLPIGFALLLHFNRHRLLTPNFLDRFGSVYSEYKPERAWWETIIMLQKLSLIVPLMFLTIYRQVQIVAFLFFLFLGLLINLSNRPFFVERYNNLQTFLRWCAVIMLMCGVMFNEGKYPHPAIEPVLTVICFFALLGGCLACLWVIYGDLMITKVSLRRNVPPDQLEFLHILMHPHGKTEVLQWLGCDRTGGRNFQGELSDILAQVAEGYQKRDLFAETELTGLDQFLHIYTGGIFLSPVIPFLREWLVSRLPLDGNADAAHPQAIKDVSIFVDCFSELNNWRRQMHQLAQQQHEKPDTESKSVLGLTNHDINVEDEFLTVVLKTLFVGVITEETQDFITHRMSQADYMCLNFLVLAVTNLKTMANAVLLEPSFYHDTVTEKQKWEKRLLIEEVQPLVPVLHILYQESFTDEAMSALAEQIEGYQPQSSEGFSMQTRSPAFLLHQLFVATRELKGNYDILNRLKQEYHEKEVKQKEKKSTGILGNIAGRVTGLFGFGSRKQETDSDDDVEELVIEDEERDQGMVSWMANSMGDFARGTGLMAREASDLARGTGVFPFFGGDSVDPGRDEEDPDGIVSEAVSMNGDGFTEEGTVTLADHGNGSGDYSSSGESSNGSINDDTASDEIQQS